MRAGELAAALPAELRGEAGQVLHRVAPLADAGPQDLAVCVERRHRAALPGTRAGAVLVSAELAGLVPLGASVLVAAAPREAFARALRLLHGTPSHGWPAPGIDLRAAVDPTAQVGPGVRVGPFVVVGAGARIDADAVLCAGALVGTGARIGARTVLGPHAVVMDTCEVGADCRLGPGATVGSDGFGLDALGRLPHVGRAVLEAGVSLGAHTCVDRATLGETRVERGAQLDNLVQVGHNARIGAGAVLCAQVGVAGGAVVEAGAVLGGQVGVNGHVTVGARARVAAQSGVTRSLPGDADYSGHPAEPNRPRLRRIARLRRLVEPVPR